MRAYQDSVQSALNGLPVFQAQVFVYKTGTTEAQLYADNGVTPLTQPILTNTLGLFRFFVADGTYTIGVADPDGGNLRLSPGIEIYEVARSIAVPIGETGLILPHAGARAGTILGFAPDGSAIPVERGEFAGDPGKDGVDGAPGASDNTYTSLTAFKASDISRKTASLVGAPGVADGRFNWTPGNFTGRADDQNVVASGNAPLSDGAWVRQGANGIRLTQGGNVADAIKHFTPQMFGAKGDGVTNDTAAFDAAAQAINAAGGGTLLIPPGTYIVGIQDPNAGVPTRAFLGRPIIHIEGCTKPVVIEGSGAKIKFADGLRMGTFNGTTPVNPALPPSMDLSKRADPGCIIELFGNKSVVVNGLELDGNLANYIMGGQWGDSGWQAHAVGIFLYGNDSATCNNVYAHDFGQDGIMQGHAGLTEAALAKPVLLNNCKFEYNGRQGLSWIGGNSLTAISCKFNHTGRRVNTGLGIPILSSPGAGVDFEAEDSIIRSGDFINCEFINNGGPGIIASSGDVKNIRFKGCTFVGVTNFAIWSAKPNMVFEDCLVFGAVANQYASLDRQQANKFIRTRFSDENFAGYSAYLNGGQLFPSQLSAPVFYEKCTVVTTRSKAGRLDFAYLDRCKFEHSAGTSVIPDQDFLAILSNATLIDCRFHASIPVGTPATGYYYATNAALVARGDNIITNGTGNVYFNSYSLGGGGVLGNLGERLPQDVGRQAIRLFRNMNMDAREGNVSIFVASSAPTTGTWKAGDFVFNQAPIAGGKAGWICVSGGAPGTWKAFGAIDA